MKKLIVLVTAASRDLGRAMTAGRGVYAASSFGSHKPIVSSLAFGHRSGLKAALRGQCEAAPEAAGGGGGRLSSTIAACAMILLFSGCSHVSMDHFPRRKTEAAAISPAMQRKNAILFLSSPEMDANKPVLLLLHGATDDPMEMMDIAREWNGTYNVLLYAYNYHRPIKTIAADLVREMNTLQVRLETLHEPFAPVQKITVVTYSYSASIFRKAVLLADDPALFSNVSLIQIVPTAGGSRLARTMKFGPSAFFTSIFSKPSAVANPYGRIAEELWGEAGSRKFHESINRARMHTILIEGDANSLANHRNEKVQRHYQNGIGTNVTMLPKSAGATHEFFPTEPAARACLRNVMTVSAAANEPLQFRAD